MTYDIFRCPKCKNIVNEHDWTMVSDDEDGFICMECNIEYFGDELKRLAEEFENEPRTDIDKSWATLDD